MENKTLDRYLKSISRRLNMPKKHKERVLSDLSTSIAARLEAGESENDIISDLGTPQKAAKELNEQMKEYTYRKSPWRFVCLAAALLLLIYLITTVSFMIPVHRSIGIIGGADGPTSIIVTSTPRNMLVEISTAVILLAVSVLGFIWLRKLKRK